MAVEEGFEHVFVCVEGLHEGLMWSCVVVWDEDVVKWIKRWRWSWRLRLEVGCWELEVERNKVSSISRENEVPGPWDTQV